MAVICNHLYSNLTLHYCEGFLLNRKNDFSIEVLFDLNVNTNIRELNCIVYSRRHVH